VSRIHLRTLVVLLLAVGLVALFLRNIDVRHVAGAILGASPVWLAFSLAMMFVNLAIRAFRWQYLLAPLGGASFGNAFRATAVGFAANSVLPARAGEVIRPYFLARREGKSATGAFATIILERLLDMVAVLVLLGVFVFAFGGPARATNPGAMAIVTWTGAVAGGAALIGLGVVFLLAGDPARLGRAVHGLDRLVPSSSFARTVSRVIEKFATGLGAIRRPGRLAGALLWSFPLWLSIDTGIWAVSRAFGFLVPFTGAFLIVPLLVLGVAVPTPGAIGGFHEAYRLGVTTFYGVANDEAVGAAIVLHLFSIGPALGLGLYFAAEAGLSVGGLRRIAERAEPTA
jgi:glycosyltransferase 2 family protein